MLSNDCNAVATMAFWSKRVRLGDCCAVSIVFRKTHPGEMTVWAVIDPHFEVGCLGTCHVPRRDSRPYQARSVSSERLIGPRAS